MQGPERLRDRVPGADGETVLERRGRTVPAFEGVVEAGQCVAMGRQREARDMPEARQKGRGEEAGTF